MPVGGSLPRAGFNKMRGITSAYKPFLTTEYTEALHREENLAPD